ncbi:MAG: MOSC domain-containing protein, partial [Alphaproteobacteria bacterium]
AGPRGNPRIVEAPGAVLSDVGEKVVSIINLASVQDIERVVRAPVDPLRFRGNVLIEGAAAWAEARWVGREITLGGVRLSVTKVIERCAAIEVDPRTAKRDTHLLRPMQQGFGHIDCGIYARVLSDGKLSVGDAVGPPD